MMDVLNFWFNLIGSIVSDLFEYPLVGDVTLGWFLLACLIIEIVIMMFFHRFIL